MDIPAVLGRLRPTDEWGPGGTPDGNYAKLVAGWRGNSAVPSSAEMDATWAVIQAERAADRPDSQLDQELQAPQRVLAALVEVVGARLANVAPDSWAVNLVNTWRAKVAQTRQ